MHDEIDPVQRRTALIRDRLSYSKHRRVVEGQRLVQAASDSFLGWNVAASGRHYDRRRFKDMKGSIEVEGLEPASARRYAALCGWTLARAHARSDDAAAIAGYLGNSETFDQAIADFSMAYADQNEDDDQAFTDAIATGRIQAAPSNEGDHHANQ